MEWARFIEMVAIPAFIGLCGLIWLIWRNLMAEISSLRKDLREEYVTNDRYEDRGQELKRVWLHLDAHENKIAKIDVLHATLSADIKHLCKSLDEIKDEIQKFLKRGDD